MADKLEFIEGDADGYCDPVTGVCALPDSSATSSSPTPSRRLALDEHP